MTNDKLKVKGILTLDIYDAEGEHIRTITEENLIVLSGFEALLEGLGIDAPNAEITEIAMGLGSTAPTENDTALQSQWFVKSIGGQSLASSKVLEIVFNISTAEGNGSISPMREFGLKRADGQLFNRIVLATGIVKTSAIAIGGTWRITLNQ